MTNDYWPESSQDTVLNRVIVIQDSVSKRSDPSLATDTSLTIEKIQIKPVPFYKPVKILNTDTTAICGRNPVADITFYDTSYIINAIETSPVISFPFPFTEKTREIRSEKKASAVNHLKSGEYLPQKAFHDDWIIGIIFLIVILFSLVRATSKSFLTGIAKFFIFRGKTKETPREISGMFQWQSTLLNLISFLSIGLFSYFTASNYNIIPSNISGFVFWLISLGIIIAALTVRHFVCLLTGILSNQVELFNEYLHVVYQSYRYGALFIFILVIIISYTNFFAEKSYFIYGAILLSAMYLIRMFRLFIIFINRNISIFYLILYLCALEILPVWISIKYFSGLT